MMAKMGFRTWLTQEAQLKKMVITVVFIALFVDNMLLSAVVPILPSYLYSRYQVGITSSGNRTNSTLGSRVTQTISNTSGITGAAFAPPIHNSSLTSYPTMVDKSPGTNCSGADPQLDKINIEVGLLLASKSAVQLLMNPLVGPLTDRMGCHILMSAGFGIIIVSTTVFAFSSNYISLLLARSVQGVGGSCLSIAGLAMLADVFKEDQERGRAMGICLTGLALGLMAGAPFGSVMYQFVGKMVPFLLLAVVAVFGGGLHFFIFQPSQVKTKMEKGTPLMILLRDPYILIAAGSICFTTLAIASLETALPVWMMKTMCASNWELGVVFLPDSISYLIASNICGLLSQKHNVSWLCACVGMILAGIVTISFGFTQTLLHLMVLNAFVGFSVGTVDSSVLPLMGHLVDLRHVPVYGTVYAIADTAVCIGFCVGSAIAGPIEASIGFPWLMAIIGTANIIFAPLCVFLLNRPQVT